MVVVSFGMSYILKGVFHPLIKKKHNLLIDGIIQIDLTARVLNFITKCQLIHQLNFNDLHDVKGNPDNKQIILLTFKSHSPCELHAQTEPEREVVFGIFLAIKQGINPTLDATLSMIAVDKQAWVKKRGKRLPSKRWLNLNRGRHCLIVYKEDSGAALPSYHILLHYKIQVMPVRKRRIHITGTYKQLRLSFPTEEDRDVWVELLRATKLPQPMQEYIAPPEGFEPHTRYLPDANWRQYPTSPWNLVAKAGPSAD